MTSGYERGKGFDLPEYLKNMGGFMTSVIDLKRGTDGCKGFTLLELLAVMALIGLLAGTAVPHMFSAVDAISAGAEERTLSEITARMKFLAYLRHTPQYLAFDGRSIYQAAQQPPVTEFEHLIFTQQQITWNANGFPDVQFLEYTLRGREKRLALE
jgi:prepilin-type N-terminal cleavage/methylation domain-containing protein